MIGWAAFDRLLSIDPRDTGCDQALQLLHVYAELVDDNASAARIHYPDVAAHLDSCGPCADDLSGLLHAIDTMPHRSRPDA